MKPSELSLFSNKEQTLLVATDKARLGALSEDELGDLLVLVRRERTKYSKLHRRQAGASVQSAARRDVTATANERTLRKAEIFEDALARVSTALASAARASRDELKRERLAAAGSTKRTTPRGTSAPKPAGSGKPSGTSRTTRTGSGSGAKGHVTGKRAGAARAGNARSQAARDRRR